MATLVSFLGLDELYHAVTIKYLNAVCLPRNMTEGIFPTGSSVFDALLSCYEGSILTTIYGPAGTGKTTVCLLAALASIRSGKKVIFIDTEGGFSSQRFQQLLQGETMETFLERIFLLKPMTFSEQMKTLARLKDLMNEQIGLIIVDSISMLYRVEFGKHEGIKGINSELGLQLNYLTFIARKWNIPVLLTSQVYADFDDRDNVKMVGGDILKYGSKCLLALEKYKTIRRATVVKHRSLPEHRSVLFEIVEAGFVSFEEPQQQQPLQRKATVSEEIEKKVGVGLEFEDAGLLKKASKS